MEILLTTLGRRSTRKHAAAEQMFADYRERIGRYVPCRAENFATEEKFFEATYKKAGRTAAMLVLLDSRGKSWPTETFAAWLRKQRDEGAQQIVFAIGPADGWSEAARGKAGVLLSLGPMTLPHELAAVVVAEQIFRAFTIIEGHPYHLGHRNG